MEQHINISTENLYLNETLRVQQLGNGDLLISKVEKTTLVSTSPQAANRHAFWVILGLMIALLFLLSVSQTDEGNPTSATTQKNGKEVQRQ